MALTAQVLVKEQKAHPSELAELLSYSINHHIQEETTEARWRATEMWLLQDIKLGHYNTFKTLFNTWWFASLPSARPSLTVSIFIPKKETSNATDKIQGHHSREPYTIDFLASLHSVLLHWQALIQVKKCSWNWSSDHWYLNKSKIPRDYFAILSRPLGSREPAEERWQWPAVVARDWKAKNPSLLLCLSSCTPCLYS